MACNLNPDQCPHVKEAADDAVKKVFAIPGLPSGSIIFVAQNSAPTGYLKANGALISRTAYAALFAAIGTTFGWGDGYTTFNLPDLRGEFVRGWGDARGVDSWRTFGSTQADELKLHMHPVNGQTGSNWSGRNAYNSGIGQDYSGWETDKIQATGGTETRPRNIALLACIKY